MMVNTVGSTPIARFPLSHHRTSMHDAGLHRCDGAPLRVRPCPPAAGPAVLTGGIPPPEEKKKGASAKPVCGASIPRGVACPPEE